MIAITYRVDCPCCGGDAVRHVTDLTNPQEDGSIEIDLEMSASQTTFTCEDCRCESFIGDLDIEHDDSGHVDQSDDEDEDDLAGGAG